jgi:hypothetical protein
VLNVVDSPDPVPRTGFVTYAVTIANNGLTLATGVSYTMRVRRPRRMRASPWDLVPPVLAWPSIRRDPVRSHVHPNVAFNTTGTFNILLRLNAAAGTTVADTVRGLDRG